MFETYTAFDKPEKKFSIEGIEEAVKRLQSMQPDTYILITPQGILYEGSARMIAGVVLKEFKL